MNNLGDSQKAIIRALKAHGQWSPGGGWNLATTTQTQRIIDSLKNRGLVERTDGAYVLTAEGRETAEWLSVPSTSAESDTRL